MMTVLQRPDTRPELWPVQIHEKLRLMIECNKTKHLYPEFNQTWEWLIVKCMPVPSTDSRTAFLDSPTEGAKPLRGPKFLATLEANLFQLFLGGGADPNLNTFRNAEAKSYIQDQSVNKRDQHIDMSSDLSAFERFVALASDVSIYEKHIAAYLAALDCFLLSGAKFGSVKTFASTHGQYQHGKTRVLFFTDIDEIMWTKPDRCDFFAQVARRVLPLAHEAKWPLENFQVELEWLFHFDPQISLPNDATPRALNHSLTRSNPIEKGDSCNKRSNEGDERPERKRRA
jgi:hypothetical protein